ncbi:MAG: hypothetical protein K2G12_09440 [Prevotella sp.]|nr:hypothetical protein [Prevotella sp.]
MEEWKFIYDSFKARLKFFLRNQRYRMRCNLGHVKVKDTLFFVFEPKVKHPGIADRLKAIISLYNICKKNNYYFKLFFETPFRLSDYLEPVVDWETDIKELEYSFLDTKFVSEQNWKPIRHLKRGKQYHCYCYAGNNMPRVFDDTGYKWCDLFHELFRPSKELEEAYMVLNLPARSYISVHLRFVNALEHFENTFFDNHLKTQEERDCLIARCKKGICELQEENMGIDIYVFSDSKVFLGRLNDMTVKVLKYDDVGHTSDGGHSSHLKAFLDLYVMSRSKKVYRMEAPELYNWSEYAKLAATIGDVPFMTKKI